MNRKRLRKKIFLLLFVGVFLLIFQWGRNSEKVIFPLSQRDEIKNEENEKVQLLRVVDGDTLIIRIKGKRERLRLIGMDAPESVKPHSPVECFGKEASEHIKSLVKGKELFFREDVSQGTQDRFGRLLGYIFLDDINLAEQMIRDGYAYEYTYQKHHPYRYQKKFQEAQREAKSLKKGLWAKGACSLS